VHWTAIAQLYDALDRIEPSPVVEVNRALAVGRAPRAAHVLAALGPALDDRGWVGRWSALQHANRTPARTAAAAPKKS
jgi:predicted RNA polymerase sigma factor